MFVYLGLFAYFAVGALMTAFRGIRRQGHLWIPAIILIVLIGFRWKIGTDWNVYEIILQSSLASGGSFANLSSEPAYQLLNWIAATMGWGLWFPNLICATIFIYGLIVFCREQPNPWLGLVVATPYLIIGVGMGFTRQSAAVGLVMVALVQFTKGKYARVFVSIGLGAMFHISAIALAPLFAIASVRRTVITGLLLVVFGFVLYFAFSERIAERMSEYSTYQYSAAGVIPRLIMSAIAAAIFLIWRRRFTARTDELRLWTLMSIVTFMTFPMLFAVSSTTIVDRLGIFLVPIQIFVLSRLPVVFGQGSRTNLAIVVVIILYSLAAELVWLNFGNEAKYYWIPYRNVLWESWFAPSG
jgi:hypothetical protein